MKITEQQLRDFLAALQRAADGDGISFCAQKQGTTWAVRVAGGSVVDVPTGAVPYVAQGMFNVARSNKA